VAARTLLHRALDEQCIRLETISRLVQALEEQQAQLNKQLALALYAMSDRQPAESSRGGMSEAQSRSSVANQPVEMIVRCFGSLEVRIGDVPLSEWRSGKARALFEYLVVHHDRPIARDVLIQALWPDPDALAAGTSLKVAVHALRQALAENAPLDADLPVAVVGRESGYELQTRGVWIDIEEFDRCCRLAGQLERGGRSTEATALYEQAADLYRGAFLSDNWDDWAVFMREGLKDQYLFVLAHLADVAIRNEDFHRGIQYARRLLEEDNCREDTFRMLMVCHARLGQPSRVRRWHELCVRALHDILDVEPDPETERVFQWALGVAGSDSASVSGLTRQ
jgi:DNA-binding SARP family transcriptional activator